jgi:AraC-like DNA-binding protein
MSGHPETRPGNLLPEHPRSPWAQGERRAFGLGGAVQQIVTTLLPDGSPDIDTVAAMVRLSVRTLQRRLSEEGLSFMRIVARARLDVAQQMLTDPVRKVIDVALDLGYSDQAHFTRAFVRWTGLAPGDFRRLRSTGCLGGSFSAEPFAPWVPRRHRKRDRASVVLTSAINVRTGQQATRRTIDEGDEFSQTVVPFVSGKRGCWRSPRADSRHTDAASHLPPRHRRCGRNARARSPTSSCS